MARYTVKTPVANFTGEVVGVHFVHGAVEADLTDPQLAYFERQGYTVEPVDEPPAPAPEPTPTPTPTPTPEPEPQPAKTSRTAAK